MDFSDWDFTDREVGSEVTEVENHDSDFGDGDGVNDFDAIYNEMNSGNESLEYFEGAEKNDFPDETSDKSDGTTNSVAKNELIDFDDSGEMGAEHEIQLTENPETVPASDMTTDESVDDALADFDGESGMEPDPSETGLESNHFDETAKQEASSQYDTAGDVSENRTIKETDGFDENIRDNDDVGSDDVEFRQSDNDENVFAADINEINTDLATTETEKQAIFENCNYHQGQNDLGALGTCGPTSIANSLNRLTGTSEYTENNVLHRAMDRNLCHKSDDPYSNGGTTTSDVVKIIDNVKSAESNIHTEVYEYDKALSVDELADKIDDPGTVAMVGVDSATLWDQRGDVTNTGLFQHYDAPSDHWITVDSPVRDDAGNVTGFNIIDSGGGVDFVDRDKFESMYQGDSGHTVSDPTAILISTIGEANDVFSSSDGVERAPNYKGSAVESDGGDPPGSIEKTSIEGFPITDGKVDGKIPIEDYSEIRKTSIHNPDSSSMTLGKYLDGTIESGSYVAKAEETGDTYFSLGNDWNSIKEKYDLSEKEMFEVFNTKALDDAVESGKTIRFSQNPNDWGGTLSDEWEYLKEKHGFTRLIEDGGYWYAKV